MPACQLLPACRLLHGCCQLPRVHAGAGAPRCAAAHPRTRARRPSALRSQLTPALSARPRPALQLARKLAEVREAAERGDPLPFTPRQGVPPATATATVTASTPGAAVSPLREGMAGAAEAAGPTPKSAKKGLLGIAGL